MAHKLLNRASRDYNFTQEFEAGLSLTGAEAKSLRTQGASFSDSRVAFAASGQLLLLNFHIPAYRFAASTGHTPDRSRPLLLKKTELNRLFSLKKQGYSLIPVSIYLKRRWWKVKIAAGHRLRKYEKRRQIKDKETKREIRKSLKRNK